MKLIVGLGNPGSKYQKTRHNIGFRVVDALAKQYELNWQYNKKFKAEVCWFNNDVILAKPQTFMNSSGQATQAILSYYKLLPKRIGFVKKNSDLSKVLIIIHDDLDIELGKYKISTNAGSAGHKGVQSIIDCLKTKNFKRIRIGIKNIRTLEHKNMRTLEQILIGSATPASPSAPGSIKNFVLQNFSQEEEEIIQRVVEEICQTFLYILNFGY